MAKAPTGKTFNGSSGNDVISGTANADTINGNGGNDTITGNGGADTITGGAGADVFRLLISGPPVDQNMLIGVSPLGEGWMG